MSNTHLPQDHAAFLAIDRAWQALVASITFDDYGYDNGFAAVLHYGHHVGYVELVDGFEGDVWEARDLVGNVVTVEVARIDAAAGIVEAHRVTA